MLLDLLNYVSYSFNGLFALLIFKTFVLPYFKKWWNNYTDRKANEAYAKKAKELIAEGNQEFRFENGKVSVFAKSEEQAKHQYRQMKRKLKAAK